MKTTQVLWGLAVLGLLFLASCTAPPEDATRANVLDAEDSMEDHNAMEDTEDAMGIDAVENGDAMVAIVDDSYEEVELDFEASTFEFEGYGPGKSHDGTFEDWSGVAFVEGGQIVGGRGVIQASSVNTGIEGLDNHLRNEDFFDVEKYPTMEFESTKLEDETLYGELTFLGVTKLISFPVERTENSISADFVVDSSLFGMSYTGVNKEVRLAFSFVTAQ